MRPGLPTSEALLSGCAAPAIQVVGVGLSGAASLLPAVLQVVESATLLIGAPRHLEAFAYLQARPGTEAVETWPLGNFTAVFEALRARLQARPATRAVVLATGDPLFFGLGRLLLAAFPPAQLTFYPQVSAVQLAFSRLKLPWQDATLVSVHGRSEAALRQALKRGDRKIAVLTDAALTPAAIARTIEALDLPVTYQLWVCENLGAEGERLSVHAPSQLRSQSFAPLNVVVLLSQADEGADGPGPLPLIGLPDAVFRGFCDRPALMTKREIRLMILAEMAPLAGQTIWDIGAGTGSVSVELSRLCPTARFCAVEKTALGAALIRHNAERLAAAPIQVIQGRAPDVLSELPQPDRVFIGGSSGQLVSILDFIHAQFHHQPLADVGTRGDLHIVLALATLEHLSEVTAWVRQPAIAPSWQYRATQINISRSLPVGPLTRLVPLNPVTLVTLRSVEHPKP